jgi:hypothetical protein
MPGDQFDAVKHGCFAAHFLSPVDYVFIEDIADFVPVRKKNLST